MRRNGGKRRGLYEKGKKLRKTEGMKKRKIEKEGVEEE